MSDEHIDNEGRPTCIYASCRQTGVCLYPERAEQLSCPKPLVEAARRRKSAVDDPEMDLHVLRMERDNAESEAAALHVKLAKAEAELAECRKTYQERQRQWHSRQDNWRASSEREHERLRLELAKWKTPFGPQTPEEVQVFITEGCRVESEIADYERARRARAESFAQRWKQLAADLRRRWEAEMLSQGLGLGGFHRLRRQLADARERADLLQTDNAHLKRTLDAWAKEAEGLVAGMLKSADRRVRWKRLAKLLRRRWLDQYRLLGFERSEREKVEARIKSLTEGGL